MIIKSVERTVPRQKLFVFDNTSFSPTLFIGFNDGMAVTAAAAAALKNNKHRGQPGGNAGL